MDKLAGDPFNETDSEDDDYVPSGGDDDSEGDEDVPADGVIPDEDEEEKKRTAALWADFMDDVGKQPPAPKKQKVDDKADGKVNDKGTKATDAAKTSGSGDVKEGGTSEKSTDTIGAEESSSKAADSDNKKSESAPESSKKEIEASEAGTSGNKIKVTQVFDFAGEKIEVEKELDKDSKEAKKILAQQAKESSAGAGEKKVLVRPKTGGGLSTIVGSVLNKKTKMGILEKSKLDWTGFKRTEGIEEDLANHNKGKDGYLEKMAFLERTDLRQFDIEKSLRDKQRSSRGGN